MTTTIAAFVYTVLMIVVILFQFALTIGLPWGEASMGGKFPGKYPPHMRVVSFINMIILSLLTLIVLAKADILLAQFRDFSAAAIWFVVALLLSVLS